MKKLEAIIWCANCRCEKYRVYRVPAANEGAYHHIPEPADAVKKTCDVCHHNLERKRT